MDVYIEYVILDNIVINSLILLCVKKTLRLPGSWWRLVLSACLGTIVAVVLPLMNAPAMALIPIKILLGIIMVLLLAPYKSVKSMVFAFLLFIAYTLLLGGGCMATLLLFGSSLDELASGGYDIALPLGLIFLIVAFYVFVIIAIGKYLGRRHAVAPFIRKVKLFVAGRELRFDAFVDSGNSLMDKASGMPVIILSLKGLERYFSKTDIEELMLGNTGNRGVFKGVHTTSFSTLSGDSQNMVLFSAEKLVINDKSGEYTTNSFMVGVTYKQFKDAFEYDMLLNPYIIRG